MNAYSSKDSQYYIKDGNLIRENNLEDHNWGKAWVYISVEDLATVAKEKKIKVLQRPVLESAIASEFINALRVRKRNPSEVGGRIFALRKTSEGYIPCWSGKINRFGEYDTEIKLSETSLGAELDASLEGSGLGTL